MSATTYAGRPVLVTGGTGFIGRHLVRRLVDDGAHVVTFARGAAHMTGVEHVRGDVRNAQAVTAIIERRFDAVFHLAGASGQDGSADEEIRAVNRDGLANVLEAIRRFSADTSICFASSRLIYGRSQYLPVDEDHAEQPLSAYAAGKRDGEAYCAYYSVRWGVRAIAVRLSNPYGPHFATGHRRYNIANWIIGELCRGGSVSVYGRGEQLRDYLYIDDAVDALLLAAQSHLTGHIYNVGSGIGTPLIDFVRASILAAGAGSFELQQWPEAALGVETGDYVANIERIRSELGWSPRVSLMEGITRTVAAQRRLAAGVRRVAASDDEVEVDELEAAA